MGEGLLPTHNVLGMSHFFFHTCEYTNKSAFCSFRYMTPVPYFEWSFYFIVVSKLHVYLNTRKIKRNTSAKTVAVTV